MKLWIAEPSTQTPLLKLLSVVILLFSSALSMQSMASSDAVGLIILSKGKVVALSSGGVERPLSRRSSLFDGDRISTGPGAKTQIKFTDGSIIALRDNTELLIENYQFSKQSGEEKSVLKLVKGGFRAITGVIGRNNPEDYKVSTNLATIGIRGTHFELVLAEELGIAVWDGGITVENNAGKMLLGKGVGFQFALVKAINQMPKGLLKPPPGISSASSAQNQQSENKANGDKQSEQQKKREQEEKKLTPINGDDDQNNLSEDEGVAGTNLGGEKPEVEERSIAALTTELDQSNLDAKTRELQDGQTELSTGVFIPSLSEGVGDNEADQFGFQAAEQVVIALEPGYLQKLTGFVPEQENFLDNPVKLPLPVISTDCLEEDNYESCVGAIENFEFDEGAVIGSGSASDSGDGGGSSDGGGVLAEAETRLSDQELQTLRPQAALSVAADGNDSQNLPFVWLDDLLVTLNAQEEAVFVGTDGVADDGAVFSYVIRKGDALSNFDSDPNLMADVYYGVWWGDVAPVEVYSDASDDISFNALDYPVFWVMAPPTAELNLGDLNGLFYFDQLVFFSGESHSGPVTNVNLRMDINVDTLSVSNGELRIGSAPLGRSDLEDVWSFDFIGEITGQSLYVQNGQLSGSYFAAGTQSALQAEGLMSGFFTGENGELLVGSFYASSMADPSLFAAGVYGVSSFHPLDRLGLLTIASGKQFGLTADNFQEQQSDQAVIGGRASDGGAGSATVEHRVGGPFTVDFASQDLIYSVTRGEADFLVFDGESGDKFPAGVAAGVWYGNIETPVLVETASGLVNVDRPVYWITALPSPIETMNILEGVGVYYNENSFYAGEGSAGPLIDFQMGFSVDFVNNQISSGFFSAMTQGGLEQDFWNFTFDGDVNDQLLSLNENMFGTVCSDQSCSGGSAQADGEVSGFFVGGGAGTVVGAFHFWESGNVNRFVAGTYGLGTSFETLGFDNRIGGDFSSGEEFELSYSLFDAFLVVGNDQPLNLNEEGGVEEVMLFNGRSLVDTDAGQLTLLKEHQVDPFGVVFRPNTSSLDQPGNDVVGGDRSIYWGRWGANSLIQDDAIDPTSTITLQDPVFWVAGNITSFSSIPVNVQRTYQTTIMLQGMGYNGAIANGSIQMVVNFDSMGEGTLTNGSLNYQTGGGISQWDISFNGMSYGAYFDMEPTNATLTEGGESRNLYGDIRGALVGESASNQGVIGGFRFEVDGDISKHSEGVFFVAP